jgi:hypothetical protein
MSSVWVLIEFNFHCFLFLHFCECLCKPLEMSSVHLFLVNLSSLKLTSINYEVAVEIVQYYGLIGKKTDDVICLFLP